MKTIGIIPNMDRDPALVFTREVMDYLTRKGCKLLISTEVAEKTGQPELVAETPDIYSQADFLAVLGGDGTILQVSGQAALCSIPLLGINLGNMGYLTAVERDGAFHALDQVLAGNYKLEQRMMLATAIVQKEGSLTRNEPILALNDACISRGVSTTMIDLELWINDEYIHTYRGDGIVVATPTGSTAYNLSAGGPILKPDVEMIAITPICAHMLFNRSFVVSGLDKVKIKISGHSHNEGLLVMDGHSKFPLKNGDEIHICRSSFRTAIMKTNLLGFYDILRQKMKA